MSNVPIAHFATQLRHGCIIMASGMGTRFGGNKLMADLAGRPLIQHVIQATEELFARRVVVTRHEDVAALCRTLGSEAAEGPKSRSALRAVLHNEPHRNDTVRLGMEYMRDCDTVTFLQGDQPLISPTTIKALLSCAEKDPNSIWRTSFEGTPGAPMLFPAWAFDELRALPQGKGGGHIAKTHAIRVRTVEASSAWELFDVDTSEDLQMLLQFLQNSKNV